MFGDYIDRGSAGAIFTSPTNPDQVIKIMNLDALDDFVKPMNNQQFEFFEKLEEQQKQGIKTPGLPNIGYTFTGEMTPEIMDMMRESVLNHNSKWTSPDEYLSGLDYAAIKSNFRYGDKYAIILMDRVSQIGSRHHNYQESLGRKGLTPMLRHVYNMGYFVRDLWPENKGMSSAGEIIWFDPMVAPVRANSFEEREAQRILLEWNEDTQRRYLEAIQDDTYFDFEHQAGLFYSEDEEDKVFGVQRHDAHRAGLHYDLRLERDDVLKSWSIPKGMPTDKRHLAIATPDHKMSWLEFEGDIPKGSYGAGNVKLDNKSTFKTISYSEKKWVFFVNSGKYKGKYTLVHWKDNKWLITMNKDQSLAAEEESMRVYRRMSWEQYFDALETGYLMSTVERYQKDGFVPKGAWGMMNDVYASTVPEFESPLEHLGRDVNPTFEIELLPTDDFRPRHGRGGVVTIRSPIPVERVTPFNINETVKRFDSEDDNYWLRGGCGKAAGLISEQLDKQKIPYHYEIGLAYIEDAFVGNHIIVIAQGQDRTYEMDFKDVGGAKQRWEDMMIADLDNPELPRSMIDDLIRFEWHTVDPEEDWSVEIAGEYLPVSGPMITKDTLSMSAEDENRYHDCATCSRKNVDNEESDEDDACHMVGCGNYFCYQCMNDGDATIFGLDDRRGSDEEEIQETYFGGSSPSVGKCCLQKAIDLGFKMYSGYGGIERLVEEGYLPNQSYVSINYVLGGVEKMSAESGQEIKEYITSIHDGYFLWEDRWDDLEFTLQTLPMEIFEDYRNQDYPNMAWDDSPVSSRRLEDTLNQFRWGGHGYPAVVLELDENGFYEIIDGYHRLNALQILDYDTVDAWVGRPVLSHNAESYPTCYLCAKPAKIEVMTAIGMRSFCGNECRGHYEGIDYGPDDYFISPKLEHQLEVVHYKPGYQERNYSEDATIKIQCKNCDYESIELQQIDSSNEYSYNKPASFYRIHPTNTLKVYPEEEDPEYFELVDCDHDMQIINQLVVGEDAWGNMISGEITVRCSKCRFADILRTDLPDGCDNKGRMGNYIKMPR